MTMYTLPPGAVRISSAGDAALRLALHHTEPRMTPLLVLSDSRGRAYAIELTDDDVVNLRKDLDTAFAADRRTVDRWWRELRAANLSRISQCANMIQHRKEA